MASQRRRVAMGDPQAPFEKVRAILAHHGLLDSQGRLKSDVELTSMGDHFDWGSAADRQRAGRDGFELLSWLASHPPEQVHLVLGNHDLARVGELASFDDRRFEEALLEAVPAYAAAEADDPEPEQRFLARWPEVPSAECVARDFATFTEAQRELVVSLLRSKRFRIAFADSPALLRLHAGVTRDDLEGLGLAVSEQRDAVRVAAALNAALDQALASWSGGPLHLSSLHHPGNAAEGEGRGIFYHRPQLPELGHQRAFEGPARRRFDPRRLPVGLTQAIGHIRDGKCRLLLAPWCKGPEAGDGPLRTLVVDGERGAYRVGAHGATTADSARLIFTDGGMAHAPVGAYALLDLDRLEPRGG